VRALLVIALATVAEARRRRILAAALLFGAVLVGLFAVAYGFIARDLARAGTPFPQRRLMLHFFLMAGLYAANLLTVMTAAFAPVDTLSGEIASGIAQTVAAKPIRRSTIVLGKWLGYAVIITGYLAVAAGGILAVGRIVGGITPPHLGLGLPLMWLEAMILLSLSIAFGSRMSTIATGVTVFGLYGLAFLGGWIEQIATLAGNPGVRSIGTAVSLLMPAESMWQLAAHHMQPPVMRDLPITPFSMGSVPSPLMVAWAVGYAVVALACAVRWFGRRAL
jgi:ABC-type transport system involved in multi-copper enzyme maturation permease subunit